VKPGDTVVVLNGTYSGDILLRSGGTAGSPIKYVAQNKWGVKLVGTGSGAGTAVIRVTGGHLIIKDFDITGTDAAGVLLAASGTSASFNQAIGNYVHDLTTPCDQNGGAGLNTGGGDNYWGISHNDFIGIRSLTSTESQAAPPAFPLLASMRLFLTESWLTILLSTPNMPYSAGTMLITKRFPGTYWQTILGGSQ
jgi:hypothetical protein